MVEAWDEPTSVKPSGAHPETSVYREGRAATVGLTARATAPGSPTPTPSTLPPWDLLRRGQLAVCAGLEHVQGKAGEDVVEVGVEREGHHVTRAQLGTREADDRALFWNVLTNTGERGYC